MGIRMAFLRRLFGAEEETQQPQRPVPLPSPIPQQPIRQQQVNAAQPPKFRHTVPQPPTNFTHIGEKNVEELSAISAGQRPGLVDDYIMETPCVVELVNNLQKAHGANELLAEDVIAAGEEYNNLRDQMSESRGKIESRAK